MGNMMQAFILLLAGFLVVFTVLVLLIVIVTLYSKIIRMKKPLRLLSLSVNFVL